MLSIDSQFVSTEDYQVKIKHFNMFKLFVFACILAFVAAEAKPGLLAPIGGAPIAYTSPLAYSNYLYGNPLAYNNYNAYAPYYKSYYGAAPLSAAPLSYAYGSYYY